MKFFNMKHNYIQLHCRGGRPGNRIWIAAPAFAGALAFSTGLAAVQAGLSAEPSTPPDATNQNCACTSLPAGYPQINVSLSSAYVGAGDIHFRGNTPGHTDALSENVRVLARLPCRDRWFGLLGLNTENIWLDSVSGTPVPDEIHVLGLQGGAGYNLNDRWTISASVGPQLYNLNRVYSDDVGVAGMVQADFHYSPTLYLVLGLAFNPDAEFPVVPLGGVRWDIRPDLTLDLMMPNPRLIYRLSDHFDVFGGGEFELATFRTDHDLSAKTGLTGFDGVLGSYREFRLGAGMEYNFCRKFSAGIQGGYSVGRQIKYQDEDTTAKFGSAPYVQAELKMKF